MVKDFSKTLFISILLLFPVAKCVAHAEDCIDVYPRLFDKSAPFVTARSKGQLGNQLYQAATAISLALDNNARYIHESRRYPEFFKPFFGKLPRRPAFEYRKIGPGNRDYSKYFYPIPFKNDMRLDGYFQSYKRFDHHKKTICNLFAPSEKRKASLLIKYGDILKNNTVVGLHIRSYYPDVRHESLEKVKNFYRSVPPPNMHYIQTAINYFSSETMFLVCCDNIDWAKKALKNIDRNFFFSTGSLTEDFHMLTLCNHVIISNSTFSWWAAYLNNRENRVVIAPVPYAFDKKRKIKDTYPSDWVLINRVEDNRIPIFNSHKAFSS